MRNEISKAHETSYPPMLKIPTKFNMPENVNNLVPIEDLNNILVNK
jgi:hypothetical protein